MIFLFFTGVSISFLISYTNFRLEMHISSPNTTKKTLSIEFAKKLLDINVLPNKMCFVDVVLEIYSSQEVSRSHFHDAEVVKRAFLQTLVKY